MRIAFPGALVAASLATSSAGAAAAAASSPSRRRRRASVPPARGRAEFEGDRGRIPPRESDGRPRSADRENAFTGVEGTTHGSVAAVAAANAWFDALRPDPAIAWQARVPRVLWELCIAYVANLASWTGGAGHRRPEPALHLLLAFMTGSTALVDAFFWAPIFAIATNFETCTGGGFFSRTPEVCTADYVKGIGRLLVSVQCVLTAVFYLGAAIAAWGDFVSVRDRQVAERTAAALWGALDAAHAPDGGPNMNRVYG